MSSILGFAKKIWQRLGQAGVRREVVPARLRQDNDRLLVEHSSLFDVTFYLRENPDVTEPSQALSHFMEAGWQSGRRPSALFDVGYYLVQNPDVAKAGVNPLVHYLRSGWREGRRPSALFDPAYYLRENPDVAAAEAEPLGHFLRVGAQEGRRPNPFFSPSYYLARYSSTESVIENPLADYLESGADQGRDPSAEFDTSFYQDKYPDVAASGINALAHYLVHGHAEGRLALPERRLGSVRELWVQAAKIDPEIALLAPHPEALSVRVPTATDDALAFARFCAAAPTGFEHLVVLPFMKRGGADIEAAHLVKYLARRSSPERVLVLVTDSGDLASRDWFHGAVRVISIEELFPGLRSTLRPRLLTNIILNFQPATVHNVNSLAGWEAYSTHGKPLASMTRLGASLFCYDYTKDGIAVGYASRFIDSTLEHLSYVLFDNAAFRQQIIDDMAIAPDLTERLFVVYQPTDPPPAPRRAVAERAGLSVLWAGRLDRQKRPDIVDRIASGSAWADFHVYGVPLLSAPGESGTLRARNIRQRGGFVRFSSLDVSDFDCFLYTTEWDGMPNVVLEAVAAGLPVIAPAVGGIPELISDRTGYLVPRFDDIKSFIENLRKIQADPLEARARAERAKTLLAERHSWSAFEARLDAIIGSRPTT